ncbi:hypothetical protein ACIBCN_18655 [Nocardia sp. NPDC051052]|uniref:hypothetical protein n=1 Tax=Nocardia sp. NPDC051052 TaxID=3364322 RepID=UPI0037B4F375
MSVEQDRFLQVVWAVARERGYRCYLSGPDVVTLSGPATFTLVLGDVRRAAASCPIEEWAMLVADRIDTHVITIETDTEYPLDYTDFTVMQYLVRTRLYGTTSAGVDGVRRMVATGLVQRVLIDHVHTVTHVTYDMLAHWPVTESELFALAERNVRADGGVDITRDAFDIPMAKGLPPIALLTGPEYLTAHARWLGDHPVTGRAGAVLIMPSKEWMYVYPVTGVEVIQSITVLADLAALHTDDPWPINSSVYWWRDGALDLAATTHREGHTVVIQPAEAFHRHTATLDDPDAASERG